MSAAFRSPILGADEFFEFDSDHHRTIAAVHAEWLAAALATGPSDRTTAEAAVSQLYRLAGHPEPEFVWVPSPPAASALISTNGLSAGGPFFTGDRQSAHAGIAAVINASKRRMEARINPPQPERRRPGWWPPPPLEEESGPRAHARQEIRSPLKTTVTDGIAVGIRRITPATAGYVTWYGQHEAPWLAHYDGCRRLGLVGYSPADVNILEIHCAIADSTGWWWPFDTVCVMAERPIALHTEPTPDARYGQRRLHHPENPAIEFPDGQSVYAVHGTIIPEWVITAPTVERINRERNVEIRRSAIERIGWEAYIAESELKLIDQTDDPGNDAGTLALYATPPTVRPHGRILLVLNGSRERDGTRRRYGLPVPDGTSSALDAAGWTYGITGTDYARLVRRT
ncbi:DUF6745 domain-containing protein [Williamsia sp. 1135]|uniref:DUF6745 domain-containing protein n=1 Tax=Williamsia sp. 1135 TaxID=1889262 RepID=UPI000A11A40C|nr:hypothetical protein [Williamsia sp. 1135]ORM30246.1 hypothetical protein BFL43_18725 [Williamsia sp. 1135]